MFPADREAIIAVQGAYRVGVDDLVVLERDTRVWGVWGKFGVRVRCQGATSHLGSAWATTDTAIRLLAPDGTPLAVGSSDDRAPLTRSPRRGRGRSQRCSIAS